MKKVMIDIETMGTHTSLSLILSVGAVAFDLKKDGPTFGDVFMRILTLEPQILAGRRIEKGTQDWWAAQTPQAREHWESANDRIHPMYLHESLVKFLANHLMSTTEIWANGIVFDIGNLENLMGGVAPWKYNVVRDARTIYQLPRLRAADPQVMDSFVGHDPVEDCKKQIWRLWEHMPLEE